MEKINQNIYLKFRPNTLKVVREEIGIKHTDFIKQSIEILEKWLKMQQHFVKKDFPKEYLERCLIMNKGSVERTKTKLDKMCTMRILLPHFFDSFDVKKDFEPYDGKLKYAMLPQLTTKQERVYIMKCNTFKHTECLSCYKGMIKVCEYIRTYDYNTGITAIIDYSDMVMMELLPKINPVEIHQFINLISDSLTMRLKSLHLISTSKMIEVLVNMLKSAMSAKLAARVFVHKNYEELRNSMNEEDVGILPKDYGGLERSLNVLNDDFTDAMMSEDFVNHLKDLSQAVTDERLRPSADFNAQYLGTAGSFRVINVD